MAELSYLEY